MRNYDDENDSASSTLSVLGAAYNMWMSYGGLRSTRLRNKNYTYGNQWCDVVTARDGRRIQESQLIAETGKEPLTNNLIRQLVKSIIGHFRTNIKEEQPINKRLTDAIEFNQLCELDSRGLEEFLISGCCVQRVEPKRGLNRTNIVVENVNINRFFSNTLKDPRGWDCEIIGELHDMSISELIIRLAGGSRERAAWLRNIYTVNANSRIQQLQSEIGGNSERGVGFWQSSNGKCRVIEVWTLESYEVYKCHDYLTGDYYAVDASSVNAIEKENQLREQMGTPSVEANWDIEQVWHCRWLSPMGDLLMEYDSKFAHRGHPYAVKMYPLTDGEVHSFVEDVIDQQKYINRLITLVDHIMGASAKGVLMFPADALPQGFTWNDIKKIWSSSNGIIPFEPGRSAMPHQISTNATNIGAYELLSLQMKLFEDISGVSGALQGKSVSAGTGAQLYDRQIENSSIALADIFETFNSFRSNRNKLIIGNID